MDKIEIRVKEITNELYNLIESNVNCGSMRCKMFDLLDEIEELS